MGNYYTLPCGKCSAQNDINDNVCGNCGTSCEGTVNIRRASIESEVNALDARYNEALIFADKNNIKKEVETLINKINTQGKAVINTSIDFLWEWLIKHSADYVSYRRQIISNSRPKAQFVFDVERCMTDSVLFGSTADIIYSALSINETGLNSYGNALIVLKKKPIESRTSALEMNSYNFIEFSISQGWDQSKPLPAGYMSTWQTKDKLAIAKLIKFLKQGISEREFANLILTSTGNRRTDNFIELYIYGKIVSTVIEKIKLPLNLKVSQSAKTRLKIAELERSFNVEYFS